MLNRRSLIASIGSLALLPLLPKVAKSKGRIFWATKPLEMSPPEKFEHLEITRLEVSNLQILFSSVNDGVKDYFWVPLLQESETRKYSEQEWLKKMSESDPRKKYSKLFILRHKDSFLSMVMGNKTLKPEPNISMREYYKLIGARKMT